MTHQPLVSCVQMHSLASVQLFDYAQGSSRFFFFLYRAIFAMSVHTFFF